MTTDRINTLKRNSIKTLDKRASALLDTLDRTFKYWALAPAVILLALLTVLPAANLLRMAVSNVDLARGQVIWEFVGLTNLTKLLDDWQLRIVLRNTLTFVVTAVSIEMVLGFFIAMVTSRLRRWTGIYRTIMVLPILVPAVAIGSMWKLLYNYNFGLFNRALLALGMNAIPWLGSTKFALISVILVDIWHWVPFVFLICLAGFESLPIEVIEAANVDGADRMQLLRYIVLPLMWPTVSVALMFRTIFAFKVFDEVFLLTSGGPGTATEVISLYIYQVFFKEYRLGYGAMVSVVSIFIIIAIMWAYRRARFGEDSHA